MTPQDEGSEESEAAPRGRRRLWAIVALVLLLLGGAVFAGWPRHRSELVLVESAADTTETTPAGTTSAPSTASTEVPPTTVAEEPDSPATSTADRPTGTNSPAPERQEGPAPIEAPSGMRYWLDCGDGRVYRDLTSPPDQSTYDRLCPSTTTTTAPRVTPRTVTVHNWPAKEVLCTMPTVTISYSVSMSDGSSRDLSVTLSSGVAQTVTVGDGTIWFLYGPEGPGGCGYHWRTY